VRPDDRDGLRVYRFESLPANRVDAFVSTRIGGVSRQPYDSLNLALHVGDVDEDVVANRRRLFGVYGLPLERSVWCAQPHGAEVVVVTEQELPHRAGRRRDRGAFSPVEVVPGVDAAITNLVGVPLCVIVADCVPIVLYDECRHAAGIVHAGWRGTVARIASRAVRTMEERYGTVPASLRAALGPSIGPERFEVGPEVVEAVRGAYGDAPLVSPAGPEDGLLDLWEANAEDLESAGVQRDRIELAGVSTTDHLEDFFSHRAEGTTGRVAACLMLR
jgi:YfiH family protein